MHGMRLWLQLQLRLRLRLRPSPTPSQCLGDTPRTLLPSVALFKYRIKSVSDNCKAHCRPAWPMFPSPSPLYLLFPSFSCLAITEINVVCGKLCKRRHNRNINAHSKQAQQAATSCGTLQALVAPRAEAQILTDLFRI